MAVLASAAAKVETFPLLTMCNVEIRQVQMQNVKCKKAGKKGKTLLCNLISGIRTASKLYCSPFSLPLSLHFPLSFPFLAMILAQKRLLSALLSRYSCVCQLPLHLCNGNGSWPLKIVEEVH